MADEAGPKRLRRSDDRMIGGVAGGIAEYLDLDPTVVRLIFALLFVLGVGVTWPVVYGVLWLLMPAPEVDPNAEPGERSSRSGADPGVIFGVMLLGLALLLLSNQFALSRFGGFGAARMAWPLLVIAIGAVAILAARDQMRR